MKWPSRLSKKEVQAAEAAFDARTAKKQPKKHRKKKKQIYTHGHLARLRREHGTYHVRYIVEGYDETFHMKVARTERFFFWRFTIDVNFVRAYAKSLASRRHHCRWKHVHIIDIKADT